MIFVLIIFSVVCFNSMDTKYDRLARYEFADETNRDIILESFNDAEIDYLIQRKIKPEQFLPFIGVEGFDIHQLHYYETCLQVRSADLPFIVSFVNKYTEYWEVYDLSTILVHYDYTMLEEFFNGAYTYVAQAQLVEDPTSEQSIAENETLYKYVPQVLSELNNAMIPNSSSIEGSTVRVREEMIEPLMQLSAAMQEEFELVAGGLIAISGYVSYEQQITLYEQALVKYGADHFAEYESYPGQSKNQLGNTISFTIAQKSLEEIYNSEQYVYLQEHAEKYGFEIVYSMEEAIEKEKPITLVYVGVEENSKE